MIDLKPCPFCGSYHVHSKPGVESEDGKPWSVYYVHCDKCECDGPLVHIYDFNISPDAARKASINLWNWRANRND